MALDAPGGLFGQGGGALAPRHPRPWDAVFRLGRSTTTAVLALAVGVALADSAVVTLALPEILRDYGAEVGDVAWVLIGFNLVLALTAVPAARLCLRADPAPAAAAGLALFGLACAGCALAPSLGALIAARVVQALGAAVLIAACLELLVASRGDERAGIARWVGAGVIGAAVGPVAGGLLTQALSWQSIFIVQIPVVAVAVPVALRLRGRAAPRDDTGRETPSASGEQTTASADRPSFAANLALALASAALTAALFLLVLLLVEGWRRSPALAAITVTAIPVAALVAPAFARSLKAGTRSEAFAGSLFLAGGLAALALLPSAAPGWTLAPQVLIGFGLGLTIDSLTVAALAGRQPRALHGGWTIAARHGGIVVGLALLTPVFTADLEAARRPAQEAIAAQVLDSPLSATNKLALADGLGARLDAERGRVPDLHPAFVQARLPAAQAQPLERSLDDQLKRAATRAFRDAFLLAALLALLAALPALALGERR